MTLWRDQFSRKNGMLSYSNFGSPTLQDWENRPGNKERIENLKWARDHCGGLMNAIVIIAKDENSSPRQIAEVYPRKNLRMKLTELNEETGEFSAIQVNA